MTVHKLTKDNHPPRGERVWLWRDDRHQWVVERMSASIIGWLEHPELAYTHWATLVEPPKPE
jgi:hypothetical protein